MINDNLEDLRKIDLPFDIDEVSDQCHRCIRKQLKKYEKAIDEKGNKVEGRFLVKCTGIPLNPVPLHLKSNYSDEEWEYLQVIADIVKWAEVFIKFPNGENWSLRPYQKEILRCTSKRKLLRMSRRTGKTTLVALELIYYLFTEPNIKLVVAGPQKTHTEEIMNRVLEFINSNPELEKEIDRYKKSPYYELKLKSGSRLRGFAAGAKGGNDGVAIRGQDADRLYCFPKGTLVSTSEFAVKPIELLNLQDTVLGGDATGVRVGPIEQIGVRKGTLITIPTALGIVKCTPEHPIFDGEKDIVAKNATQTIASLYFQSLSFDKEIIISRLLGFVYGDGWISNNLVGFSGQEKDLEQIQMDLSFLGDTQHAICTRFCENKTRGIKGIGSSFSSSYIYPIFKDLHLEGKKVFQKLSIPLRIKNGLPHIKASFLSGLFSAEGTGFKYQKNRKTPRTIELNMRSQKYENIKSWIEELSILLNDLGIIHSISFKELPKEDRWIGFISISNNKENLDRFAEKIGYCYNFKKTRTLNEYHLYRKYESIWEMKCWQTNRLINNSNKSTNEISDIFGLSKSTIKYHKRKNSIYSDKFMTIDEYLSTIFWKDGYVKIPILLENVRYSEEETFVYNLTSGANNRFFANGFFTHNCEEMDYIAEESIQGAILPLLSTSPNTTLVGFSTPTGYPTIYYRLCVEDPRVIEFHYSYKVLEHAKDIELERPNFTTEQWKHEYLAEFSGSDAGVYKPEDIQIALQNYKYSDYKYESTWKYCIGTDWNEIHGTEIIVLGFNPMIGKFIVVDSAWIQKSDFTQLAGIAKLLEMNAKWNPNYIYIDSGNGSTNEELLRKTSLDARKSHGDPKVARLLDILRKYDSGSSLKIKDPVTREDIKMPAKPFMVNASVRLFEQHKIFISSEDSTLEKQLKNYLVVRLSPTKTPVYGLREDKVKDHRLDALNLAIVAFQLEFNELHVIETCQTFGIAFDPRTIQKKVNEIEYKPSDRRLGEGSLAEKIFALNIPARINFHGTMARGNPGWDTDTEDIESSRRQQRLRSKRNMNSRPTRTNI